MHRILIVDDELGVRHSFKKAFARDYWIDTAADAPTAIERLRRTTPDLVLLDIKMPGMSGMEALRRIRESHPELPVVMMTAYGDTQKAIQAMRLGALDYMLKPLSKEDVRGVIEKALRVQQLRRGSDFTLVGDQSPGGEDVLVGNSEPMLRVYKRIGQVAKSDVAVLIHGESGTGKELVARAIHANSRRSAKPFAVVNCAALPESLLETELFGYERGAFTGASDTPKPGKLEVCDRGTFLLDEIGDMSLVTQAKVLRVLHSGEFQKVGGVEDIKVDVRILAATNKNLEEEIRNGRFREDLFHRINVVSIELPPLRDRKQDIEELLKYMIHRFNDEVGAAIRGYTPDFLARLCAHDWPGNVRELENVVKKAMVVCQSNVLSMDDCHIGEEAESGELASGMRDELARVARRLLGQEFPFSEHPFDDILQGVEKALIEKALEMTGGNQVKASHLLGIARTTLRKKIDDYGIMSG